MSATLGSTPHTPAPPDAERAPAEAPPGPADPEALTGAAKHQAGRAALAELMRPVRTRLLIARLLAAGGSDAARVRLGLARHRVDCSRTLVAARLWPAATPAGFARRLEASDNLLVVVAAPGGHGHVGLAGAAADLVEDGLAKAFEVGGARLGVGVLRLEVGPNLRAVLVSHPLVVVDEGVAVMRALVGHALGLRGGGSLSHGHQPTVPESAAEKGTG